MAARVNVDPRTMIRTSTKKHVLASAMMRLSLWTALPRARNDGKNATKDAAAIGSQASFGNNSRAVCQTAHTVTVAHKTESPRTRCHARTVPRYGGISLEGCSKRFGAW